MMVCPSVALDSSGAFVLFGLSLSKPGRRQPVRVELVETWAWSLIWRCAWFEGGSRDSPGGDSLFFASPKKSKQKKGDPQSATPALRCGANLRRGGCGVRRGTRFALARAARTTTASQITKHARSDARATPQPPRRRRSQQGWDSRTAIRAIALLGPAFAARGACAREGGAELRAAKQWPARMFGAWVPFRMRRGAQRPADQGSRLSERSEFERDPAGREHRRLPGAKRRDAACRVAFSLVPFFWRPKRKGLACRATPGLRPQRRHAGQIGKEPARQGFEKSAITPPTACALRKSRTIKTIATSACWISARGQKCSKSRTSTSTTAAPTSCAT
jgi:hypothetical protein